MIWHIFKKDFKLLWLLVIIVAALHILNAAIQLILGHFMEPRALAQIPGFPIAVLFGVAALIVTAAHQDAMPGDRQDWLVRPIRRRDLLLAKILFVLIAVQGPMLLVDLAQGMANGFTFWASLSAALARGIYLLLIFSLPMLALAAITTTIVEVIGGALAICLIVVAFLVSTDVSYKPIILGGMDWMIFASWSAVALAAAVAVVPLQYFRRATMQARGIALGAVLVIPASAFIPWGPAFAFQKWLSVDPAAAKSVVIAFDPNLGKITLKPGAASPANSVWLPLRVSGLAPESFVISARADVRITGRDGTILFQGRTRGDPQITGDPGAGPNHIDDFPVRTTAGGDVLTHQLINLPGKIYELVRSQPVRMELDYSLTLFHIAVSDKIAPLNGDKRIAGYGWCQTRLNDVTVEIGCINTDAPSCTTFVLENTVSGQRNPTENRCPPNLLPDYTPVTAHFVPSAMLNFGGVLRFRDPLGLAKYPVDSSQLANAQVILKSYQSVAHFTRHLTIPEIRLGDWEADTHALAASTTSAPK